MSQSNLDQRFCLMQPAKVFRHLHINNIGPNIADPEGIVVIGETDNTPRVEGVVSPSVMWTGWRARLIRWLVNFLLPEPEKSNGRFTQYGWRE